ncbi:glycosyltransferase family 2 protein [Methanobacterium ferruginis]|uniref:glycosyltransferase family 2 protein n=1 Tax=Methanobacterium ferruginis TaxID=710191 RepID=UPI0025741A78|nr:glycosyltransferase family 2 protein [Methanobacterium ferruginis]BDZ68501.1 glycosyl transferase [Methanobacterium ferruginis]
MKISVLIHTLNEEKNIKSCLESVKWADEIIVVDMYSDDNTVDIARNYTDKIFLYERMGYADPARQFALEKASCEWVLAVDADEIVPLKLRNKLCEIMEKDMGDVIYVPHNNYFIGKQIFNMGWGPLGDLHPRFFKKKFVNFGDEIHEFFKISENARSYSIDDPEAGFLHFSYIDFEHYIEKALNGYTSIEARNVFNGKKPRDELGNSVPKILFTLFRGFFDSYVRDKGYKDGFRGFCIAMLSNIYRLVVYMKIKLMEEYDSDNPRKEILEEYEDIKRNILLEYENEK